MAHVRVEVTRSGGFAGVVRHAALDGAQLEPQAAETLARLVAAADLDAPHAPAKGADRFQYDIAVTGADGRKRQATVGDGAMSPQLKALVQHVLGS